ncbi:hypothetical protein niasHT_032191 [Heterodera trifolii]|uniref:Uncharacterized protein n=1 Tax=Heterodera trifolii TaxID=157864 RepID=A0ABD2HU52_9BILA
MVHRSFSNSPSVVANGRCASPPRLSAGWNRRRKAERNTTHSKPPLPAEKQKPPPAQRFAADSRRRPPEGRTVGRTDTDRRPSIDCQQLQQNQQREKRERQPSTSTSIIIIIIISQQRVSVLCVDDRPAAKDHSLIAAIRVQIHQQQRILDGRNGAHKGADPDNDDDLDNIKQNDDMDFDLLIKRKLPNVIRKSGPFRKMNVRGKAKDTQQKHGNDLIKSGADQQHSK